MFSEFDGLIEPSRNHRAYRIAVGKLQPPILPFMPLLLKGIYIYILIARNCSVGWLIIIYLDMTFTHEGNRTLLDSAGLVNFEKMHMLAQTMRTLRYCRSRHLCEYQSLKAWLFLLKKMKQLFICITPVSLNVDLVMQPPTPRSEQEVRTYIRNLRVIDNQRILTGLSQRLEPKRAW